MLYFLLFISELALLFFLSRRLINALARVIFRFTKSHKAVVNILAIIFLPGTIFHELAHLLFAGVMLVPVGEINVLPEVEDRGVKLGSVQIGHTDPLRRMIIGLAPVLIGILSILTALYFVRSSDHFVLWQVFLVLYLVFEIGNTMFSSKRDLEGAIGFFDDFYSCGNCFNNSILLQSNFYSANLALAKWFEPEWSFRFFQGGLNLPYCACFVGYYGNPAY